MMRQQSLLLWIQTILSLGFIILGINNNNHVNGSNVAAFPSYRREIPEKVLIGYVSHAYENVRKAVMEDGVNVVIWAFMDVISADRDGAVDVDDETIYEEELMAVSSSHRAALSDDNSKNNKSHLGGDTLQQQPFGGRGGATPRIKTELELGKIKALINELDKTGYSNVVHLASFGGWDGHHLDPSLSAQEWYSGWKQYSIASDIFHGIDWDLEGNDNMASPTNVFTLDCLDKMGEISRLMKEDGYVVAMAPPQSYLNFNNPNFSRYVNLTIPDRRWHSDFDYFGSNIYGYLLAKYGNYIDLISIQLYESYSDAAMSIYHDGITAPEYLYSFVQTHVIQKQSKMNIDFSQDASLNMKSQLVELPLSKLVIGLANGWALKSDQNKTLYISPLECEEAYLRLKNSDDGDLTPRGFMFWTIQERGTQGVYLAREIGQFLHS
ncbi:hypothetical protein ACHAXR_003490 [Thalassiosira sp. AJA248-18]